MPKLFRGQFHPDLDSEGNLCWVTVRKLNGSDIPYGVLAPWSKKPKTKNPFETFVFTGNVIKTDAGEVKELELVR